MPFQVSNWPSRALKALNQGLFENGKYIDPRAGPCGMTHGRGRERLIDIQPGLNAVRKCLRRSTLS